MKQYFKEQLNAGPADGVSKEFKVYYLLEEGNRPLELLGAINTSIESMEDKYEFVRYRELIPVLRLKDLK